MMRQREARAGKVRVATAAEARNSHRFACRISRKKADGETPRSAQ